MRSSSAPVTAGPSGRPIAVPIARAVRGWSPVSMLTRTPAAWQAAIASWTPGRGGSTSACRPIRRRPPSSRSIESAPSRAANTSTRRPSAAWRSISARRAVRVAAAGQHGLGRALDVQHARMQRGHQLVRGVERQRVEPRVRGARGLDVQPRRVEQRRLGGIAERAGGRRCTARPPAAARGRRRPGSTAASTRMRFWVSVPGLVGGDDGRAAERLHRRQVADDRAAGAPSGGRPRPARS